MNSAMLQSYVDQLWDASIVPALMEYIRIPNKSPLFDPAWEANGFMQQAVTLIPDWCVSHAVPGMRLEVITLPGRTPVIFIEVPGASAETILLYGHLDKQPEMTGWDEGLGPWQPVLRDAKLYGRGGADDGYAAFASLAALKALHEQGIPHARCVILIEACEESGSYDLPFYITALAARIGQPQLVICLDSGCGNYAQLWLTTSLRGMISGTLHIDVLQHGIHSGMGSGIVPACTTIARQLLARLEDAATSAILPPALQTTIPAVRQRQAQAAAAILQNEVVTALPFLAGVQPLQADLPELILNRTWRAALSVTGAAGLPALQNAGNVTLPHLALKLSLRVPPNCAIEQAAAALRTCLEAEPPYQAQVRFDVEAFGAGWDAPATAPWLTAAVEAASQRQFGRGAAYLGEGGSIPFMGMLGARFPNAQFVITGVLGPGSNAHGPNEFLHVPTGKKVTACVAEIIAAHYQHAAAEP